MLMGEQQGGDADIHDCPEAAVLFCFLRYLGSVDSSIGRKDC
jgi:hypothetical protein